MFIRYAAVVAQVLLDALRFSLFIILFYCVQFDWMNISNRFHCIRIHSQKVIISSIEKVFEMIFTFLKPQIIGHWMLIHYVSVLIEPIWFYYVLIRSLDMKLFDTHRIGSVRFVLVCKESSSLFNQCEVQQQSADTKAVLDTPHLNESTHLFHFEL